MSVPDIEEWEAISKVTTARNGIEDFRYKIRSYTTTVPAHRSPTTWHKVGWDITKIPTTTRYKKQLDMQK